MYSRWIPCLGHILALVCILQVHTTSANKPWCRITCGVVSELTGNTNLQTFVRTVWSQLKVEKDLEHVEISRFDEVEPRRKKTMTDLYNAYTNIGSSNASMVIGSYMQPIATATEKLGIPYFVTSDIKEGQYKPYNVITIFPKLLDIYNIALDIVDRYEWRSLAVFYEDMEGLYFLEGLIQKPQLHVRSWKIAPGTSTDDIRQFLLEVRQLAVRNVIILSSKIHTNVILKEALRLSMMSSVYSWLIPSLNYDKKTVRTFSYTQVNMTTFHLAQSGDLLEESIMGQYTGFEYATIYDSLLTFYRAVRMHHRNTRDCLWKGRQNIENILSKVDDIGATGHLAFRQDGTRQGYQVDILGLNETGFSKVGLWQSSDGATLDQLEMFAPITSIRRPSQYPLGKDKVSVVTILEEPFLRRRSDYEKYSGNARFEGFIVDLLDKISDMLDFEYVLYLVPDDQYGERQSNGKWNGLVGELVSGNASLAVAALSITSGRESVIDFTKPYKADGISIVMRRPGEKSSFFQFTEPLSGLVWLLMLGVFFFTSITMYILDRIAPPPEDNIRFTVHESLWFTFASMMLSGTDIHPRTVAGRMLAGALWLFSLIIISTYTANLAAFLTVSKFDNNIRSLFDLLDQSKVMYGTVSNSDVGAFFQNNKISRFQQLWQMMSVVNVDSMVDNSATGFARVRNTEADYAFIWDSAAVKFQVEHDCNLMEIGQAVGSRGYGIGVPLGAHYRDQLSMAILKLAETGDIAVLEERWWKSPKQCPDAEKAKPSKTRSLSINKVGGVFIILGVGVLVAIVSALLDYVIRVRTSNKTKNRQRPPEKPDKNVYDGAIPAALQLEEPFLAYGNTHEEKKCTIRKQTNIF